MLRVGGLTSTHLGHTALRDQREGGSPGGYRILCERRDTHINTHPTGVPLSLPSLVPSEGSLRPKGDAWTILSGGAGSL